jgi:hypothetical protein
MTTQGPEAAILQTSAAKIQGFIGIVAITVGNLAAIMTHVDEIRQYVSKVLGTNGFTLFIRISCTAPAYCFSSATVV